jgi:hypothetical protein
VLCGAVFKACALSNSGCRHDEKAARQCQAKNLNFSGFTISQLPHSKRIVFFYQPQASLLISFTPSAPLINFFRSEEPFFFWEKSKKVDDSRLVAQLNPPTPI